MPGHPRSVGRVIAAIVRDLDALHGINARPATGADLSFTRHETTTAKTIDPVLAGGLRRESEQAKDQPHSAEHPDVDRTGTRCTRYGSALRRRPRSSASPPPDASPPQRSSAPGSSNDSPTNAPPDPAPSTARSRPPSTPADPAHRRGLVGCTNGSRRACHRWPGPRLEPRERQLLPRYPLCRTRRRGGPVPIAAACGAVGWRAGRERPGADRGPGALPAAHGHRASQLGGSG